MKPMEDKILDVRAILAKGEEPFSAIMEATTSLLPGQDFCLIAPFEPLPLYPMFEAEGYFVKANRVADGEWHIQIKSPNPSAAQLPMGGVTDVTKELDFRFLEPSALLQKSLEAIGGLARGETLVLHTRFWPEQFFEQVDPEAFDYDCEETASNNWTIHIWRIGV